MGRGRRRGRRAALIRSGRSALPRSAPSGSDGQLLVGPRAQTNAPLRGRGGAPQCEPPRGGVAGTCRRGSAARPRRGGCGGCGACETTQDGRFRKIGLKARRQEPMTAPGRGAAQRARGAHCRRAPPRQGGGLPPGGAFQDHSTKKKAEPVGAAAAAIAGECEWAGGRKMATHVHGGRTGALRSCDPPPRAPPPPPPPRRPNRPKRPRHGSGTAKRRPRHGLRRKSGQCTAGGTSIRRDGIPTTCCAKRLACPSSPLPPSRRAAAVSSTCADPRLEDLNMH